MGLLSPYTISIVQSKLTPEEVADLDALAERHGATTSSVIDKVDIIITAIGASKRLQRHLNVDEAISVSTNVVGLETRFPSHLPSTGFHHIGRSYEGGRDGSLDDKGRTTVPDVLATRRIGLRAGTLATAVPPPRSPATE